MSSMVRASWPISAGPALGMEVAKSPCPRRTAASVRSSVGWMTRWASSTPANTASTANTTAVMMRRHTSELTISSVSAAGARVSISATSSPVDDTIGKLDTYRPSESIRCTSNPLADKACECSEVNSLTGVAEYTR
jgi:hypothetical protein